ncbi:MAG: winged helix-turn-helix domain-containing protein [Caldilineaceae bacterium]
MTPTESKLLNVLMAHQGATVPSRFLLQRVWPMQEAVDETLRVHMSRLRRKLELADPKACYIETERAVGYRFVRQIRPAGCGPLASEPISTAARPADDGTARANLPHCQDA